MQLLNIKTDDDQEKDFYRTLFDNAGDAIFIHDFDGNFLKVNQASCRELGYSRKELLKMKHQDIDSPQYLNLIPGRMTELMKKGRIVIEAVHVRQDSVLIPIELRCNIIEYHGQLAVLCLSRDLTGCTRIVEELRERAEIYRSVMENIDYGISLMDTCHNIVFSNASYDKYFKKVVCRNMSRSYFRKLHNQYDACDDCPGKLSMADQKPHEMETEGILSNGDKVPVKVRAFPAFGSKGTVIGFVEVVEDISEKKRLEEEKEKLESQIRHAQKMETVGTLAGGIAHDLNNLLQPIISNTELLLMHDRKGKHPYENLKEIESASLKASELIHQLLTFSRKAESRTCSINFNRKIKEVKKLLVGTVPKKIIIKLDLVNNLKPVNADPNQVEQVLINLAINARDAMPEGGRLTFTTRNLRKNESLGSKKPVGMKTGDYIVLEVSDTGCGMDSQVREHIFEPFFTTKEQSKGTGLGLSMVYGIVMNHHGYIDCQSTPGQGTVFTIYWPVSEIINERRKPVHEPPIGGTETILVVDDEEAILDGCEQILTNFGYRVITAPNCEKALEIYHQEKIDLVLLDLILPGMGGKKCLESLLQKDKLVKVIVASGFVPNGSSQTIIEAGAKHFIKKPYNINRLLKAVREILDEK